MFDSFFLGGFECSTHRRADGRRLDLVEATGHDRLAASDYATLARLGLRTIRDGLRWHRIETGAGRYDWSSFLPMLRASRRAGLQVIWDLCHYGWPDGIDIWSGAFVERFAAFCEAAARVIRSETDQPPLYCVINEMSFWAWAGGEMGYINPNTAARGAALKRQLVLASIAASHRIRAADPRARFVGAEPLVNVVCGGATPELAEQAERHHRAQYEVFDMLTGRMAPELGGSPDLLDIVGANYYPENQWYFRGCTIPFGHHCYRPLRDLLQELYERYRCPILISETGAEGGTRAYWLHYVCGEVTAAKADGIPVAGICLYPITDYPGWDNDRHCQVGLLSIPDVAGCRDVDQALLAELRFQQGRLDRRRVSTPFSHHNFPAVTET